MASIASIFIANIVSTPRLGKLEILLNRLVAVDSDGFIQSVVPSSSPEARSIVQDHPNITAIKLPSSSFLLPTFVDLHLHAPQFLYLGTGLHLPLMQWLDQYAYRAEERLDADPILARKVYSKFADRLIEAGTGAILAFGTIKEETNLILANVLQSKGIRGFVGKLSMDQSSRPTYVEGSAAESLEAAESFIHRCRESLVGIEPCRQLVRPVITPRFVPTCSDELLASLGKLAQEEKVLTQSHLAEARDQVDWVRSTRGAEDIDVFDKHGLLTPQTIQAHCTFLDSPSLSRMVHSGSSIAHCPLSNAYFSTQQFRLREALDLGVTIGLGSDIAGGYQCDIMGAMRSAVTTSRIREGLAVEQSVERDPNQENQSKLRNKSIDWKEAIYLATCGGSAALGLATGQFVAGAPFDAQQIDLANGQEGIGSLDFFDMSNFRVSEESIEKWWCLGDWRNRSGVWVQGQRLQSSSSLVPKP